MVWSYALEPDGAGTRVTESYQVVRPMTRAMWFVIERVCGRLDRRSDLQAGMRQTLEKVKAIAEQEQTHLADATG
jgi:hypothetical protein